MRCNGPAGGRKKASGSEPIQSSAGARYSTRYIPIRILAMPSERRQPERVEHPMVDAPAHRLPPEWYEQSRHAPDGLAVRGVVDGVAVFVPADLERPGCSSRVELRESNAQPGASARVAQGRGDGPRPASEGGLLQEETELPRGRAWTVVRGRWHEHGVCDRVSHDARSRFQQPLVPDSTAWSDPVKRTTNRGRSSRTVPW